MNTVHCIKINTIRYIFWTFLDGCIVCILVHRSLNFLYVNSEMAREWERERGPFLVSKSGAPWAKSSTSLQKSIYFLQKLLELETDGWLIWL